MAKHQHYVSLLALALLVLFQPLMVAGDCIASNQTLNDIFAGEGTGIPRPGSCCMMDVCGLECPVRVPPPTAGYGDAVIVVVLLSVALGVCTYLFIQGGDGAVNFFVAGRNLPLWMLIISLASQSLDSNSLLGNVELSYRFGFWDGAVFPLGLGLSLVNNGIFLAHHIQRDGVLTLPDVFAKRYGRVVEVLVSVATICSFIMLLAGNLYGFAVVTSYIWNIKQSAACWVAASVIWSYTAFGGLFGAVYTSVFQAAVGWSGLVVMTYWFIANEEPNAPPPSIGFPGYIYPDTFGEGGACDMYNGTACTYSNGTCCYNSDLWCPLGQPCDRYDRGAYPIGDQRVYPNQMTNPFAMDPYPNGIFWNWCTIFILGFGNLGALDFQARCMASRTARNARIACIVAGCITFFIGIPFAYLGAITRVYYGPDSVHSIFEADSCHEHLGLPTCGQWVPDEYAFVKLLTHQAPPVLGAWALIGVITASMSTADGAILAMSTVVSNNLLRQLGSWWPSLFTSDNLLMMARIGTVPLTVASTCIAAYYTAPHSAGGTGYLLIVAFDIVFATVIVPLFGCFYVKTPSPRAALVSILGGAVTRIILEFVLPKDGYLLLPFDDPAFYDVGPAASANPPAFIDTDQPYWDPVEQPCDQRQFADYTGVDSLTSFFVSLILFMSIQCIEYKLGRSLFFFPGSVGYTKETYEDDPLNKKAQSGAVRVPLLKDDSEKWFKNEASEETFPQSTLTFASVRLAI